MPEDYEGEGPDNLDEPPPFFPYEGPEARDDLTSDELVEVQIEGVFQAENSGQTSRFVLVSDGVRRLPIVIGPFEAQAIQLILEGTRPDRPMTHDLTKIVMDRLGCVLDRVVIDDFWNTIYYAKLFLKREGTTEEIQIDSRPSDAIALAVRFEAPIFVADSILDAAIED